MDGKPLGDGHFRLVVPGDKRGARSVRNVARISVSELPTLPSQWPGEISNSLEVEDQLGQAIPR
jgi:hypothetical protein